MNVKRSLLVGATVATLSAAIIGDIGIVSAATNPKSTTDSTDGSSLVDKITAKFNLKKTDVQAVFDEDRQAHQAQMEANQREKLATAVQDGKLTQAQADHIVAVMNEINALRGTNDLHDESSDVRNQIKTKLDDLRAWAIQNNIDKTYIMMGHGPHDGMGRMGDRDGS